MPGQLLPLRLLRCSTGLLRHPTYSPDGSGRLLILCRSLPFGLRCSHPSRPPQPPQLRAFSSLSSSRGGERRRGGELRAGGSAANARSLVDDEAELSDWVGDLKMDSLRFDSDSDGGESFGRGKGKGGGVRQRESVVERGRGGLTSRRQRRGRSDDDEDDAFGSISRKSGSVNSSRPLPGSRGRARKLMLSSDVDDEDEDDGDEDEFSSVRQRGRNVAGNRESNLYGRRGGRDSHMIRGGTRDRRVSPITRRGHSEFETGRGQISSQLTQRGGRVGEMGRGRVSSPVMKRGGRELELDRMRDKDKRRAIYENTSEDNDDAFEDESGSEEDFSSESETEKEMEEKVPFGNFSSERKEGSSVSVASRLAAKSDSYLSETTFDQCPLSPLSLKGIKDAGYERLTMVQEATLPVILKGKDVLAKAKTGTGKTVAFLLPAIEIVLKQTPVDRDHRRPPIYILVICPTRELANQAAMEGSTLLKYHPTIGIQFVTGGTRLALEQKRMQANPCQILVATPGRLRDHIENTPGFASRLMGVKVLVLDEADHLLDMGFRKDIENIIAAVPKQRQTLLFSATVPDEVRQVCHIALKRDHEFINTVEEGSEETHSQVTQVLMTAELDQHFSLLYHILKEHISDDVDYKVLVFCTTAMVTKFVAEVLAELKLNVREIHSRKPQSYRTRVSDEFRKSKGLILVTSDVSARGVDYPDVTLVMQVGVPSDREQYIHRLGRTGRKGKEGQGILLLAPWEQYFASNIKDLPISKAPLPSVDLETRKKVERALSHVGMKTKESAYQAWLGYYNSNKNVGRDKYKLVELANEFSRSMGLDNPPAIGKVVLGKMGLRNIPGLRSK